MRTPEFRIMTKDVTNDIDSDECLWQVVRHLQPSSNAARDFLLDELRHKYFVLYESAIRGILPSDYDLPDQNSQPYRATFTSVGMREYFEKWCSRCLNEIVSSMSCRPDVTTDQVREGLKCVKYIEADGTVHTRDWSFLIDTPFESPEEDSLYSCDFCDAIAGFTKTYETHIRSTATWYNRIPDADPTNTEAVKAWAEKVAEHHPWLQRDYSCMTLLLLAGYGYEDADLPAQSVSTTTFGQAFRVLARRRFVGDLVAAVVR